MASPFQLVLATRNAGKIAELRALLGGLPVVVRPAGEEAPEVEEDAPSLEGNARKKAQAWHDLTGLPALADDTGLEVAALGGRPGVRSARYAGPEANDAANRALLLRELEGRTDRSARFRTVLAFVEAEGVRSFEGVCRGRILEEERGTGGFGYDALFVPEGETRTFAELSAAEKNAISHRGRALRAFAAFLRQRIEGR
jgi:XTP/dITP diphosphohydrolase